jgi:hypothetical protein
MLSLSLRLDLQSVLFYTRFPTKECLISSLPIFISQAVPMRHLFITEDTKNIYIFFYCLTNSIFTMFSRQYEAISKFVLNS